MPIKFPDSNPNHISVNHIPSTESVMIFSPDFPSQEPDENDFDVERQMCRSTAGVIPQFEFALYT